MGTCSPPYAKQSITQTEHIYILSEQGHAKLVKIMDNLKIDRMNNHNRGGHKVAQKGYVTTLG